jgi:hypothetical protein
MTPRYFYVEDDTAILIAANGTALAALLINAADIITNLRLPLPTFPMWVYLTGLVFAFGAKAVVQLMNDDIRQREKLQHARDFMIEAAKSPDLTPELNERLQSGWLSMEEHYSRLLKPVHGPRLDKLRAFLFLSSALCFLIATSTLIVVAGRIAPVV